MACSKFWMAIVVCFPFFVAAQGHGATEFTYQGQLTDNGGAVNDMVDLDVSLWDAAAAGTQVGATISLIDVPVSDGLFSIELDFGAEAFKGERWLEIAVDAATLSPRQKVTAAPYAIQTRGIFVDANDRVGIGTTQPNTALEVSSAGDTEIGIVGGDGGRRWTLQSSGGTDPFLLGGTFQIIDRTAAAARLVIDHEGNVGIGTSYPGTKLTVDGDVGLLGDVYLGGVFPPTTLTVYGRANFRGDTYMDGNVGINLGFREPENPLHVVGSVQIDSGGLQFGAANENTDPIWIRRFNPAADQSFLIVEIGDNPGAAGPPGDRLQIQAGGQPQFIFDSDGGAYKTGTPGWGIISDARAKRDIEPLTGVLDQLMQLRGHSFHYNEPNQPGARAGECIGFVAQEVEPLFPEWVSTGPDGMKRMAIAGFEALAVEALRDLRAEKDAEIASVRAENEALQARLKAVEGMLKELAGRVGADDRAE